MERREGGEDFGGVEGVRRSGRRRKRRRRRRRGRVLVAHVEDSLGGVKVEAGGDQGFGGLPELALLSK